MCVFVCLSVCLYDCLQHFPNMDWPRDFELSTLVVKCEAKGHEKENFLVHNSSANLDIKMTCILDTSIKETIYGVFQGHIGQGHDHTGQGQNIS